MTGNTVGWLAYSFLTSDPFVFFANAPGLLLSLWLNFGAAKLQYVRISAFTPQEKLVLPLVLLWLAILFLLRFLPLSSHQRELAVGVAVNLNLVVFYGAPLSALFRVLFTKNSATIHRGTTLLTATNSAFWTLYGLALLDPFIYLPNGAGLLFGGLQIMLCCCYPGEDIQCSELLQQEEGGDISIRDNTNDFLSVEGK